MLFSTLTFLFIFLPVVLAGYYLINDRFKNIFLLIASLFFYAWGEPKFVLVMIATVIMNYVAALFIQVGGGIFRKFALSVSIGISIGVLFVFKYLNFATLNLSRFSSDITVTNIALPIGISFFTFQGISYVVDVYREPEIRAERNPINVGLYIAFFPQLIAGPIVRYNTISKQIHDRKTTWNGFCIGVRRFLIGFFKKILLSNNFAIIADNAFTCDTLSISFAWIGAVAYALQIFFDFSGYSDMAIGLGKMFGFQFEENFNYPYISGNVTEFWRRWHISLSTWFRDYVYIPLGGDGRRAGEENKSVYLNVRNLFLVWLLTGIWHGASWNFVVWGLVYFVLLVLEKFAIHPEGFSVASWKGLLWRIITLVIVLIEWVIFRSNSLKGAGIYIASMFGVSGNLLVDGNAFFYAREYIVLFTISAFCATPAVKKFGEYFADKNKVLYAAGGTLGYMALFIFAISYLVMGSHNPFIYFNF